MRGLISMIITPRIICPAILIIGYLLYTFNPIGAALRSFISCNEYLIAAGILPHYGQEPAIFWTFFEIFMAIKLLTVFAGGRGRIIAIDIDINHYIDSAE